MLGVPRQEDGLGHLTQFKISHETYLGVRLEETLKRVLNLQASLGFPMDFCPGNLPGLVPQAREASGNQYALLTLRLPSIPNDEISRLYQ